MLPEFEWSNVKFKCSGNDVEYLGVKAYRLGCETACLDVDYREQRGWESGCRGLSDLVFLK